MGVDDRLRRGLTEIPPADPSGVYERIVEKKVRRGIVRKMQSAALTIAVIVGSAAGFVALVRGFVGVSEPGAGPTNGLIAFSDIRMNGFGPNGARIQDDWHVYTMSPDGGGVSRIGPQDVKEAIDPTWSPDGSHIAFVGFAGDPPKGGIYVMDAAGANVREIYPFGDADRQSVEGLRWSPDGARIGFQLAQSPDPLPVSGYPHRRWTIWSIAPDGSDARAITTAGREMHFSWSPNGTQIVFERFEPISEISELASSPTDLFVVNSDGGDERRLTDNGVSRDPAWSPDGSAIAFEYGDHGDQHVALIGEDGSDLRTIVSQRTGEAGISFPYGNSVVWSPDATMVAFSAHGDDDVCYISTVDVATGSVRKLISTPAVNGCPGQEGMSWAPAAGSLGETETPTTASTQAVEPSVTQSPEAGEDIGLASRVCDLEILDHIDFLGDGTNGTAWTGAEVSDGRCPQRPDASHLVAVDYTGDGVADDGWRSLEYCVFCRPYAATDLDGDGSDELIVLAQEGTTPEFDLFDVRPIDGQPRLRPITVAAPGDADAGFPANEAVRIWTGGDEGFSGVVQCEGYPERPEVIVGWADGPVDGPGSDMREVHITRLRLEGGAMRVLESQSSTQPSADPLPYPFGTDGKTCGVDWNPLGD